MVWIRSNRRGRQRSEGRKEGPPAEGAEAARPKRWYEKTSVTLCVAAGLAGIGLGFIHVIVGVEPRHTLPFDVARRESFGYREILVNATRIRALPYPIAKTRYPIGCRVLQNKGYMASGRPFETRAVVTSWDNLRRWQGQFEETLRLTEPPWPDQLLDPIATVEGDPDEARIYNRRGVALARTDQYTEAIAALTRAIRKAPTHPEIYHNRALVYVAIGNLGQAAADLGKIIEIRPGRVEGRLRRGRLHMQMNRYDDAVADFTGAIEIAPTCAEAYARRSLAHYAKGRYDKAADDVNHLSRLGTPIPSEFLSALEKVSGK